MLIETILKTEDGDLAPLEMNRTRLVVAAGGVYRERRSPILHSSTKVDLADLGLADHSQFCRLSCGKINRSMHRTMLGFFKYAHDLHGGEAALVLLYDPERRQFRWHCPPQCVTAHWSLGRWIASSTISFENPTLIPEGFLHFGDSHLHVGSVAPSATDLADDQDGLHIIVGDLNYSPKYHVDFVIDRKRFGVAPELIFDDPSCLPFRQPPRAWRQCVRIEKYVPYPSQPWTDRASSPNDPGNPGNGGLYA
jgi:hypothetical protein